MTLQDGTAAKLERFEAVRVSAKLGVSKDSTADEDASRATCPGNFDTAGLQELFGSWWQGATVIAEAEALRRAHSWQHDVTVMRGLEQDIQRPDIDRWDQATREAILGDYERQLQQPTLFVDKPVLPPAIRRRLDDHRKWLDFQRSTLERRARFAARVSKWLELKILPLAVMRLSSNIPIPALVLFCPQPNSRFATF